MTAYYNEIDPYAAQWLRNLIEAGHIAPGYVDERSIEDVYPSDLRGFTQCHFFAGIGVWSHGLRSSGWSDDRPVWTGSCPCQPLSSAGKGAGFDDERHLWPAFHHLIKECKPEFVIGEQVASSDTGPWIDLVQADLEAMDYAFGAVPFPSAGIGAPHIRDRLYWVADATDLGRVGRWAGSARNGRDAARVESKRLCNVERLGNANNKGSQGHWKLGNIDVPQGREAAGRCGSETSMDGGLDNPISFGRNTGRCDNREHDGQQLDADGQLYSQRSSPTNGYWRSADWIFCRDGKWRPVESGTFPLAHGAASRVGRLRAYGNAINAKAAQVFIESLM